MFESNTFPNVGAWSMIDFLLKWEMSEESRWLEETRTADPLNTNIAPIVTG
jgi:hypothetical protein